MNTLTVKMNIEQQEKFTFYIENNLLVNQNATFKYDTSKAILYGCPEFDNMFKRKVKTSDYYIGEFDNITIYETIKSDFILVEIKSIKEPMIKKDDTFSIGYSVSDHFDNLRERIQMLKNLEKVKSIQGYHIRLKPYKMIDIECDNPKVTTIDYSHFSKYYTKPVLQLYHGKCYSTKGYPNKFFIC